MSIRRLSLGSNVPWLGMALLVFASSLPAQRTGRELFQWNGRVDREVQITMRGRDAWVRAVGQNETRLMSPMISSALPQQGGTVSVRIQDGRGDARVVQQPSRQNDYTAIVRITDRSGGADSYRVNAYWSGAAYGDDSDYAWNNGRTDQGRDRDRNDGRADRGGRDNSDWGWGRNRGGYAQNVLRWSGQVDDAVEIRIQGNQISYRRLSGKGTRDVRADFARGGLPRGNAQLQIRERSGRGDVYVVQQPSARNGYTAIIRIYDPRPSYGFYDFDVTARNGSGYGWGYGNGR